MQLKKSKQRILILPQLVYILLSGKQKDYRLGYQNVKGIDFKLLELIKVIHQSFLSFCLLHVTDNWTKGLHRMALFSVFNKKFISHLYQFWLRGLPEGATACEHQVVRDDSLSFSWYLVRYLAERFWAKVSMTSPKYCQNITSTFLPLSTLLCLICPWPEGGYNATGPRAHRHG